MSDEILFCKIKPTAVIPTKRNEDAGYDIYACFEDDWGGKLLIKPNETVMVPTGIASAFSEKYVAIIKERGTTGSCGIGLRCGVVDSGFRGEWFIALTNHTNKLFYIDRTLGKVICDDNSIFYPYSKAIAQVLFVPLAQTAVLETDYDTIKSIQSERGDGSRGSSQK